MSDGTLSVRRRQPKAREAAYQDSSIPFKPTGPAELSALSLQSVGEGRVRNKTVAKALGDLNEMRVENRRAKRLKQHDKYLKNFKYSAALDSVLRKV